MGRAGRLVCRGRLDTLEDVPITQEMLGDDEEVLVDVRPHWIFFVGPAVLTVVAAAVAITVAARYPSAPIGVAWVLALMGVVPALWLAARVLRWLGINLVVTTRRLILRRGLFGRELVQIRLSQVSEVHCYQTLTDRIVGSGRLTLDVQGEDGRLVLDDVRHPRTLQRLLTGQLGEVEIEGVERMARPVPPASRTEVPPSLAHSGPGRGQPGERTPPHGTSRVPTEGRYGKPAPYGWVGEDTEPGVLQRRAPGEGTEPGVVQGRPPGGPRGAVGPPAAPVERQERQPAAGPSAPPEMAREDAVGGLPAAPRANGPPSVAARLIELDDLRRRGILTDEEFARKKAELLDLL